MVETKEELTIQQVAEQTGLTVHTLRYYERAGLLSPVARNGGGHRRYTQDDVTFLIFLTRLRTTGMPIHQVRRYAELVREGAHTIPIRQRMLENHRDAVKLHMAELAENLRILDIKINGYGCLTSPLLSGGEGPGVRGKPNDEDRATQLPTANRKPLTRPTNNP